METIAVLLMAYGSPESLDEIEPYLLDIRGGRPTPPELVAEIRHRYELTQGCSPLLELTKEQADMLERELNRRYATPSVHFKTYVGMRHWEPRIKAAVEQIAADDQTEKVRGLIGLVMAPHAARMSTGAYFSKLQEAVQETGAKLNVTPIHSWHDQRGLIASLAEQASAAMARFETTPYVVFTAHSLPERILKQGDPYDAQLHETAALVANKLGLLPGRWEFCYQSAGQSGEKWLGPQIYEVIPRLAQEGEKNILVTPVGFLCDHVEILYDLDIEAQRIARQHGVHLERSASLNSHPTFIRGMADLVWTYAAPLCRD